MHSISREYWFSAAHQLEGHPKCGRLHGHNYRVVVTLTADELSNGMILDYASMDLAIKPIIDGRLDHRYLLSKENISVKNPVYIHGDPTHFVILPIQRSTAEEISEWLFIQIQKAIPYKGIRVSEVVLEETPKSQAIYSPTLVD